MQMYSFANFYERNNGIVEAMTEIHRNGCRSQQSLYGDLSGNPFYPFQESNIARLTFTHSPRIYQMKRKRSIYQFIDLTVGLFANDISFNIKFKT